jgi:hypothetical protein
MKNFSIVLLLIACVICFLAIGCAKPQPEKVVIDNVYSQSDATYYTKVRRIEKGVVEMIAVDQNYTANDTIFYYFNN